MFLFFLFCFVSVTFTILNNQTIERGWVLDTSAKKKYLNIIIITRMYSLLYSQSLFLFNMGLLGCYTKFINLDFICYLSFSIWKWTQTKSSVWPLSLCKCENTDKEKQKSLNCKLEASWGLLTESSIPFHSSSVCQHLSLLRK